ncbi:hypothetical protein CHS0354_036397 [Potamilus streckersoni]|uniref:Uncharacterized protein n=1 Tax=Potamilus streckersoni TaxID=2493646 RepID=A0AAE0W2T6_9BIVA|nr:hypothetical protein CHS0354_036397 [Potamilus streckersoni]
MSRLYPYFTCRSLFRGLQDCMHRTLILLSNIRRKPMGSACIACLERRVKCGTITTTRRSLYDNTTTSGRQQGGEGPVLEYPIDIKGTMTKRRSRNIAWEVILSRILG